MIPEGFDNEYDDLNDDFEEQVEKIFDQYDDDELEDEWDEFDEEEFPDEED
ncbi:MAG: hypothetical protein SCALA702_05380 [Melioribacteraceae bacterium]|nr:MAG: hypothetical protein SCALA702_05380 [Melioribacteraceae bacterium]